MTYPERDNDLLQLPIVILTLIALVIVLLVAWVRSVVPSRHPPRVRDVVVASWPTPAGRAR